MRKGEVAARWALWAGWRLLQILSVVVMAMVIYRQFGLDNHLIYRLDVDVYRMGARAWLDGTGLYGSTGSTKFTTQAHTPLAFTYPPLAAILLSGFAMVSLPTASSLITAITLVLLVGSVYLVLDALDVWPEWTVTGESAAARRVWLALLITGLASVHLEPIWSNFGCGQINVLVMALVLADVLPRRTVLPRGVLVGLAIAIKLTPAVFLLYFAIKRDWHAVRASILSFVATSAVGLVFAWRDSIDFWLHVVATSGSRIADLRLNTNQNILSFLSRQPLPDAVRGPLWLLLSLVVLVMVAWAIRRACDNRRAGEDTLAVACVALLGLLTSPISWTHHWVWVVPILISTAVVGYQRRNLVLLAVSTLGLAVTKWSPVEMLPSGHEWTASWWCQLIGTSYVWWALIVIIAVGLTVTRSGAAPVDPTEARPAKISAEDMPEVGARNSARPVLQRGPGEPHDDTQQHCQGEGTEQFVRED